MKKPLAHRAKSFLKRHRFGLVAIPVATLVCTGFIYWYSTVTFTHIAQVKSDLTMRLQADDVKIKQILVKKAAELKARQEMEARATADNAATANDTTASTVDSSTCNLSKIHNNPAAADVVVNKKHCIQPVTFVPDDLQTSNGVTLSAKAITAFDQMFNAAAEAGQGFYVTSGYRSYSNQVATYNYWVSVSGANGADTYSARPGYSEHQTGFAFDVAANGCTLSCFGSTSQYAWFQEYAADYGFIQRYYAGYESITGYVAEEWHYRYVGVVVAKDMKTKGIKTLEQYWNISGGDYY